jgi:hypothetical protein
MSDDSLNRPRTLGGGNSSETSPTSRPSGSSGAHIGRVGDWGGSRGRGASCRIAAYINIYLMCTLPLRTAAVDVATVTKPTSLVARKCMFPATLTLSRLFLTISPRFASPSQRDKCPESGQGTQLLWPWSLARSPCTRTRRCGTLAGARRSAEVEHILGRRVHVRFRPSREHIRPRQAPKPTLVLSIISPCLLYSRR